MNQSKFLLALLLMCVFLLNCSREASIELSEELQKDGFEIIETSFLKDEGIYFFITNKPLNQEDLSLREDYIVTAYENASDNFFESVQSFFDKTIDESREVDKYFLPDSYPKDSKNRLSNLRFDNPSFVYRLDYGKLGKVDLIDKIVISKEKNFWK